MTARLVSAEVGAARFGEFAPGERIPLLRRASAMYPVRRVVTILCPVMFAIMFVPHMYKTVSGGNVDPLHVVMALLLGWFVVGNSIQAGWLPGIYSLEWSPAGLDAKLLWWSDVIPPGTEVVVRFGLLFIAVRAPAGRWYPVPGVVFDRLVEAREGLE